jgi:hypothetical protein
MFASTADASQTEKDVPENKLQIVYLIVKTKLLRGKTWIMLMQGDK